MDPELRELIELAGKDINSFYDCIPYDQKVSRDMADKKNQNPH